MKRTRIYVSGMSCVSCEVRIANELGKIEGVERVLVCHRKQTADIEHDLRLDHERVQSAIKALGYGASLQPIEESVRSSRADLDHWIYAILLVLFLYLLYAFLKNLGLFDWLQIGSGEVTFGLAFLIGLVASVSTCLAVVGGVVMSFAAKYQARGGLFQANVKPHLLFHTGRLASFFVLGGLLGIIGSRFALSGWFMGWFTVLIAVLLFWLGLNIMGYLPSPSRVGIRMPKSTLAIWNRLQSSDHPLTPILIGAFTFFLPCGFTQSMQLFAVSTGSFAAGALTMFLFALGTAPVLLGLGFATSRFSSLKSATFSLVIGMVVIVFAVGTLLSGFAQAGINVASPFLSASSEEAVIEDDVQVVAMALDSSGYHPSTIKLRAGVPVRWEINAKQITGCTNEIIVPSLDIRKPLESGMNVVEFTPEEPGTIGFSCWMGMVRGKFIVE